MVLRPRIRIDKLFIFNRAPQEIKSIFEYFVNTFDFVNTFEMRSNRIDSPNRRC